MLRHCVTHIPLNFRDIACWVNKLNDMFYFLTRVEIVHTAYIFYMIYICINAWFLYISLLYKHENKEENDFIFNSITKTVNLHKKWKNEEIKITSIKSFHLVGIEPKIIVFRVTYFPTVPSCPQHLKENILYYIFFSPRYIYILWPAKTR